MFLKMDVIPTLHEWLRGHRDTLDALVFDIDGVLLVNGGSAPGSHDLLDMLRTNQVPFFLLTNDGDHSTEEKAKMLQAAGLQINASDIVSCADGLKTLHTENRYSSDPFFIMGNLGNPCFAMKAGLNTTRDLSRIGQCQGIIVGEKGYDWETVSAHIREIPFPAGIFLRQAGFPETGADGGVLMKVIRDGLQMLDKLHTPTR